MLIKLSLMTLLKQILIFCLMVSGALMYAQTPVFSAKDTVIFKQLDSLFIKANKHISQKQYTEALQLIDSASVIAETNYGRTSSAYSAVLHYKGNLYYSRREFSMAEPLWVEEERIKCSLPETQGEKCMHAKQNLALLWRILGKLDSASVKFNETKVLYEQLQIRDWGYAQLLNSIGNLMSDLGQFEQAIDCFQKSDTLLLQLRRGQESPNNWLVRNGLATAYYKSGNYDLAEHIITDIRQKQKKNAGEKNNLYIGMTILLANIYSDLGQHDAAIQLLLQAKSIREAMEMQKTDAYANVLLNLANNYAELLQYDTAILYFRNAVGIYENEFGRHHPGYLLARQNEGALYAKKGDLETAERILQEVLADQKATTGVEHPSVAKIHYNLADVYAQKNELIIADSILGLALNIQKNTLENNSPDYVQSLRYAAIIGQRMGGKRTAVERYQKALMHYRNLLIQSSKYQTEFQLEIYTSKRLSDIHDLLFSFLHNTPDSAGLLAPTAYDQILLQKGFLLYTSSQVRLWAKRDTFGTKATYEDFISVKRRIGSEYLKPIAERQKLPELEARADSLEKVLVRTVAGFGEALRQVNWREVQGQLRPGEAAVEFVHYRYYDHKARATDSTLYAAIVLLPSDTAPRFVPLCEARQIEAAVREARADQLRFQNLYNALDRPASPLYPLVWQPLIAHLEGVQTVYYSSSGMLHTLNLSAIQPVKRETLSDRYRMVALVSTRQLVVPTNVSPADSTAVVFGGIRYEMDSTKIAEANRDYSNASDSLAIHNSESNAYDDNSPRGSSWPYLPQTKVEAINISNLLKRHGFQTTTRLGFSATEEFVKRLGSNKKPSPQVLHFATHGFFLPAPVTQARQRNEQATDLTLWGDKGGNNPMFRSVIFLAGANHGWKTGKPLEGLEDGILTAYEVSQMDLINTDLVVLAACMTGLGDIQGNEGVYGLQRAFKIAGVRYVLMTLWEVPEPETQELVESFYTKWLVRGLPVPDAFRAAQKEMREVNPNPYYWAGFVLLE